MEAEKKFNFVQTRVYHGKLNSKDYLIALNELLTFVPLTLTLNAFKKCLLGCIHFNNLHNFVY